MEENKLNIKQNLFCKHFIENKGNATKAYQQAYWIKSADTARTNGSKLLTNANIMKKINKIMEENGFNDVRVDFELWKTITQDENMQAKMRWIDIYNKMKKRYDETIHISNDTEISIDLSGKTVKELELLRQKLLC